MRHSGFSYDFTMRELIYFAFHEKKCPLCGKKLMKKKCSETVKGAELNSKADPVFVPQADIKHYFYLFTCCNCQAEFTLKELAN